MWNFTFRIACCSIHTQTCALLRAITRFMIRYYHWSMSNLRYSCLFATHALRFVPDTCQWVNNIGAICSVSHVFCDRTVQRLAFWVFSSHSRRMRKDGRVRKVNGTLYADKVRPGQWSGIPAIRVDRLHKAVLSSSRTSSWPFLFRKR